MKSSGALGVVAVGVALVVWGVAAGPLWLCFVGGLLVLGGWASAAPARRSGQQPDVTLRPGGEDRPWRRGKGKGE